jgi:formate hydrogenlyase subunit 3/multisubunit Na+/H+ antiporter MnhD subunit
MSNRLLRGIYLLCVGIAGMAFFAVIASAVREDIRSFIIWSIIEAMALVIVPIFILVPLMERNDNDVKKTEV